MCADRLRRLLRAVGHLACGCSFSSRRNFPEGTADSACGDNMVAIVLGVVAVDLGGTTAPRTESSFWS
jgi:hypothetical protein